MRKDDEPHLVTEWTADIQRERNKMLSDNRRWGNKPEVGNCGAREEWDQARESRENRTFVGADSAVDIEGAIEWRIMFMWAILEFLSVNKQENHVTYYIG